MEKFGTRPPFSGQFLDIEPSPSRIIHRIDVLRNFSNRAPRYKKTQQQIILAIRTKSDAFHITFDNERERKKKTTLTKVHSTKKKCGALDLFNNISAE